MHTAANKIAGRNQHARRAVATLECVLGSECVSQKCHDSVVVETFDRAHRGPLADDGVGDAGA